VDKVVELWKMKLELCKKYSARIKETKEAYPEEHEDHEERMQEAVACMMSRVHDIIWYRTGGKYDWAHLEDGAMDDFIEEHMNKGTKKIEKVVNAFEEFMNGLME
jgi:hypothetical protein